MWENDHRLKIKSAWIQVCRFPNSLREVCITLESLQRKKDQVDWIAEKMIKSWHLEKQDGTIMSANKEDCRVSYWSGSSTWGGVRWTRDETKIATNEYYVKTIIWKPNREMTTRPQAPRLKVPESFPAPNEDGAIILVHMIKRAGIPTGLAAEETMRRYNEWVAANPMTSSYDGDDEDAQDDNFFDYALGNDLGLFYNDDDNDDNDSIYQDADEANYENDSRQRTHGRINTCGIETFSDTATIPTKGLNEREVEDGDNTMEFRTAPTTATMTSTMTTDPSSFSFGTLQSSVRALG